MTPAPGAGLTQNELRHVMETKTALFCLGPAAKGALFKRSLTHKM